MDIYSEVNKFIAKAEKVRTDYGSAKEEIKRDDTLSEWGRRKKREELHSEALDKHKAVMKEYKAWREELKDEVISKTYRHPEKHKASLSVGKDEMYSRFRDIEDAYREHRAKEALEYAKGSRDKLAVRALVAVAYSRRDWAAIRELKGLDNVAELVLDYESLFGSLADTTRQVKLNIEMRAPSA